MKKPRKITAIRDKELFFEDIKDLCRVAIQAGAWDVAIIGKIDLIFSSDKSKAENSYKSAHWPVSYVNDDLQAAFEAFSSGVFFSVKTPPAMPSPGQGLVQDKEVRQILAKTYELAAKVESAAFYMGYSMSLGFACGNCRAVFCHNEKRCWAMIKGRVCMHPYKARPSMTAAGLDPVKMAKALGWEFDNDEMGSLFAGLVMVD